MQEFNQRSRKVLIDENLLRQMLNQLQTPEQRHALVPRQTSVPPNEYQVINEDSIRDDELSSYLCDAPEIDLNTQRNVIKPHTFWQ